MLNAETIKKLDALSLAMREYARGGAGGIRKSRALGSSAEFSDFREYVPGDDTRRVDWNAYARFDRLFLRLFMEEQETYLTVILDGSASMRFGEKDKWEYSRQVAEALIYLALRGGDRARICCLTGAGASLSPSLSGRAGYMTGSRFLDGVQPEGKVLLSKAMRSIPLPSKGMCVVLTDLLSEDGWQEAVSALMYRGQQTSLVCLLSREELEPELAGAVRLIDSEGGENVDILVGREALEVYHRELNALLGGATAFCQNRGVPFAVLPTDGELLTALTGELARAGLIL